LPFGKWQKLANSFSGFGNAMVSGWSVDSILTVMDGFPFTAQIGYNSSNDGDTRNPVRPFLNPNFTGPVVVGTPSEWFNPAAIAAVPSNSGFFGNLGGDPFIGPGLATWDFSVVKDTHIRESLNLQFRAEIFNMLDRANFNTPNLITWVQGFNTTGAKAGDVVATPTPSGLNGSITSTSTASRQ